MAELTLNQFLEINENLITDEFGNTNKKCPLCGENILVEKIGTAIIIRCKNNDCFKETMRGI